MDATNFNNIYELLDRYINKIIENWPEIESSIIYGTLKSIDLFLSPSLLLRQLALAVIIQGGIMSFSGLKLIIDKCFRVFTKKGITRKNIQDRMKSAKSYSEWKRYAEDLDALDNLDKWRLDEECNLYDVTVLKKRMSDIRTMMNSEDVFHMMYRLRGALARDQFGMQQEGLFTRAAGGTKVIVEEYHQLIANSLNYICDHHDEEVYYIFLKCRFIITIKLYFW